MLLLLHAGNESSAQQKNKPNQVAELDTGQGTRDERWDARCGMREGAQEWTRQISRVYLGRSVWPVSFQHLHMFPVTFDDYMIFLLFTRRVAFSFYLAWFVFCFGFCFCCCCHLRNVQRNGATADALHKNKSPTHSLTHTHTHPVRIETTTWHMSQAAPGSSGFAPATAPALSLCHSLTLPLPMDSVVSKALEIYVQFNSFMTLPSSCNVRLYRNMYIYLYCIQIHI